METPQRKAKNAPKNNIGTPLQLPATPFLQRLGFGTGVEVYRIQRSASTNLIKSPWAVKRVTRRVMIAGDKVFNKRILEEAEILRRLNHPNVIGFRSIVKDTAGRDVLALEDCDTSLGDILEARLDENLGSLESAKCEKVISDIAKALDYIHTEAKILHGDIKSHNVLVKGQFSICKLCDFGVCLPLKSNGYLDLEASPFANYVGTELWSAKEVFEEDEELITTKADIYAFGITIYEMITCQPPFIAELCDDEEYTENNDSLNTTEEDSNITEILEKSLSQTRGNRPALPEALALGDEYNRIIEIFYICTCEDIEDRPSAKVIVTAFENNEK